MKQKYYVVGTTHRDPAWIMGPEESSEQYEVYLLRLIDLLEQNPSFKYVLEMTYHYRKINERRPDIIQKLNKFFQEGRLEFGGGLATSAETNIIGPESLVRNQLLGLAWIKEHFDTEVQTGYLIDTFGISAQMPQLLKQFGLTTLLADRFGGCRNKDAFCVSGLDGSKLKIIGRDLYSPYIEPGVSTFFMVENREHVIKLFDEAAEKKGEGPYLVIPYAESYILGQDILNQIEHRNASGEDGWAMTLAKDYFEALDASGFEWPQETADLNPEFTATFSQRIEIKKENRRVEYLLQEADKWAALAGRTDLKQDFDNMWWLMAFNHVHDMITGSHNSMVYGIVMDHYAQVGRFAQQVLSEVLEGELLSEEHPLQDSRLEFYNGLPWERSEMVSIPVSQVSYSVGSVRNKDGEVPYQITDGQIRFEVKVPACSSSAYWLEQGEAKEVSAKESSCAAIENQYIRLVCDTESGIQQLIWKPTGKVLLEHASDFLVLQRDTGNFQFENPNGAEVPAGAGEIHLYEYPATEEEQKIRLDGKFPVLCSMSPDLDWVGTHDEDYLTWSAEFVLTKDNPVLALKLKVNWKGENSRIRLKLATNMKASDGVYEIPFGVVNRKPYGSRMTARGEWPAYRFAALEDEEYGLALINKGVPGVEVSGPIMWTTILRAPSCEYAGMYPDDTSSQHGEHSYEFGLLPYSGSWKDADVLGYAQKLNAPLLPVVPSQKEDGKEAKLPQITLSPANVLLSGVKIPEDQADEVIVRVYESAGTESTLKLYVNGAELAWNSDMPEKKGAPVSVEDGCMEQTIKPFEIKTFRIKRTEA